MNKKPVRYLIWVYFWLIIFEGALRRWIFPNLSDALLLVRDPIAILIFILGLPLLFKEANRNWILTILFIGIFSSISTMLFGHQDWLVTLWSARITLLHFPIIFIISEVFTEDDFFKLRNCIFITAIPMTILLIAQYILPKDHWVNIGTGGEGTASFLDVFGKGRPPGTFSFISGVVYFYSWVTIFLLSSLSDSKRRFPVWAWITLPCIIVSLIFSISRTLIYTFAFTIIVALLTKLLITRKLGQLIYSIIFLVLIFFGATKIILQTDLGKEAFLVTQQRWISANKAESKTNTNLNFIKSFKKRLYIDEFLNLLPKSKFFGYGIGIFSNPAAIRIPKERKIMYEENGEIEETFYVYNLLEYGFFLFFLYNIWKFLIIKKTISLAITSAQKYKNPYSLMLCSFSIPSLLVAWLHQPNSLGFTVFTLGLTLFASKIK